MVGNAADARLALAMYESEDDSALIGEGATRKVYKIGNVAYKVNDNMWDDLNSNVNEFESVNWYKDIPGVRIPEMEMYGDVLAMEFISGELTGECEAEWLNLPCECPSAHVAVGLLDELRDAGYDTTWGNVIRNSEGYWLIDMGH